jgi:hypothetical protein
VPWIAVMSYYTIIWLSIFKPMKKTAEELEKQDELAEDAHGYKYIFHEEDDLILKEH